MSHRLLFIGVMLFCVTALQAQQTDTVKAQQADTMKAAPPAPPAAEPVQAAPTETAESKVYYGGYVGASFGDYSSVEISPLVGYKVSPVLSAGVRATYEYLWHEEFNASNYGGSVFAIARIHPKIFLQTEFQYISYEIPSIGGSSDREWVPFWYVGGGFVQPLGGNASLVASVMVDVLQDENSPYEDWNPTFSIGVIAGF